MKHFFRIVLPLLLLQAGHSAMAQPDMKPPALVVGIVVDQMRYDYLERYWNRFSGGGFRRLVNEGFLCRNANYSYVPTYTAPGHACIYTGAPPSVNGIISNDWFDRNAGAEIYCVSDSAMQPVGTTSATGRMSPHRLLCPTVTDALRLATSFRSKCIGIGLKDRGAILPAGRSANAAYWHDPATNSWVTSSYYSDTLPAWLIRFNEKQRVNDFLSRPWTTLRPLDSYTASTADDTPYEYMYYGETKPVFPHDLPAIRPHDTDLIRKTPFGDTWTKEMAVETIRGENLGKSGVTDFLCVSFSSTDYIGHMYGTRAVELEDTYLRLDNDLAGLLTFLDEWLGENNVLVFLTADHGAADNVHYARDHGLPGGTLSGKTMADTLNRYLESLYGPGRYAPDAAAAGIYLDHDLVAGKKLDLPAVRESCANFLRGLNGIQLALPADALAEACKKEGLAAFLQRGFYPARSPDVMLVPQPGWMEWTASTGTSHGSPYTYDTHVPLVFYGRGIPHGSTDVPVDLCDIAPTISNLLHIPAPACSSGTPVHMEQ